MKDEITIPDQVPDNKEEDLRREEDLKAAHTRREKYSLARDIQAKDDNDAIARRLEKDKENKGEDKGS
ncbi:MAG: hypothetical protein K0B05_10605 [Bacteroidales bacterium]|nr:hypothetical protein [Bacteroidales bacterium]